MSVWPVRRTLFSPDGDGAALREAVVRLRQQVASLGRRAPTDPSIRRVEVDVDDADPLAFLAAQAAGERRYFRSRDGVLAVAGVGVAAGFSGLDDPELLRAFDREPDLIGHLAGRFDPARELVHEWSAFGDARVVIPAVELRRTAAKVTLAANLAGSGASAVAALERLAGHEQVADRHSLLPEFATGFGAEKGIDSSESAWRIAVEATLRDIEAKSVRKIVLARTRTFRVADPLDPCELLLRLSASEPGTYQFLIEQAPGVAFVGASPERLFRRVGRTLDSEAVAGTRPRAHQPDEDRALAEHLFASEKDRLEHRLVLEQICERLGTLVVSLRAARYPHLLRLANVQHLSSPVHAILRPGVTDAAILDRLHPTPAVCGQPVERARTIIRACEPFDRGLYAGPIGVIGAATDVCVGIRSALIAGRSVTAFAGAGVVAGSNAEGEWRETEHKLATFERLVRPA